MSLVYVYQNVEFTDEAFQEQSAGRVSLQFATKVAPPTPPHPRVSKKLGVDSKLERLSPALRQPFWKLDGKVREFDGVTVLYRECIRYSWASGLCAEALVEVGSIHWNISCPKSASSGQVKHVVDMYAESDTVKVLAIIQSACY